MWFVLLGICAFTSSFTARPFEPLVNMLAGHFAVSAPSAALLAPAYALPLAVAALFMGPLGDRWGKKRGIAPAMAALSTALLVGCLSSSLGMLAASRALAGGALFFLVGAAYIGVHSTFMAAAAGTARHPRARGAIQALAGSSFFAGQALGAAVFGAGLAAIGPGAPFAIAACVLAIVTAIAL